MMKAESVRRELFLLFVLFIAVFLMGCTQPGEINKVDAYTTAIDKLYQEDSGLNGDIKYIALDTSSIINLDDSERQELLQALESYGFTVLDMTMEELEEEGYIKDLFFEEGILFEIKDETMQGATITMDISKWRSGLGAIGYDGLIVKYKNGKWEIVKQGNAWIS